MLLKATVAKSTPERRDCATRSTGIGPPICLAGDIAYSFDQNHVCLGRALSHCLQFAEAGALPPALRRCGAGKLDQDQPTGLPGAREHRDLSAPSEIASSCLRE